MHRDASNKRRDMPRGHQSFSGARLATLFVTVCVVLPIWLLFMTYLFIKLQVPATIFLQLKKQNTVPLNFLKIGIVACLQSRVKFLPSHPFAHLSPPLSLSLQVSVLPQQEGRGVWLWSPSQQETSCPGGGGRRTATQLGPRLPSGGRLSGDKRRGLHHPPAPFPSPPSFATSNKWLCCWCFRLTCLLFHTRSCLT